MHANTLHTLSSVSLSQPAAQKTYLSSFLHRTCLFYLLLVLVFLLFVFVASTICSIITLSLSLLLFSLQPSLLAQLLSRRIYLFFVESTICSIILCASLSLSNLHPRKLSLLSQLLSFVLCSIDLLLNYTMDVLSSFSLVLSPPILSLYNHSRENCYYFLALLTFYIFVLCHIDHLLDSTIDVTSFLVPPRTFVHLHRVFAV